MDRVRFGRALGFGARAAVKTLVTAVDAATAENPSSKGPNAGGKAAQQSADSAATRAASPDNAATRTAPASRKAAHAVAQTVTQVREVQGGLRSGSRRFKEAAWGPFVRLSGVLWLEVSGVFFGVFALIAAAAIWRLRADWRISAPEHRQLVGAVAMLALFGYFCVSSFVRARRRERGR